jgi:hypothetical protein
MPSRSQSNAIQNRLPRFYSNFRRPDHAISCESSLPGFFDFSVAARTALITVADNRISVLISNLEFRI